MLLLNKKVITSIVIIILIIVIYLGLNSFRTITRSQPAQTSKPNEDTHLKIVSTSPSPLDGATITPNQQIEIMFSQPLKSPGDLKYRIEPAIEFNLDLLNDKKVLKITPRTLYNLGASYTLYILPETIFENGEKFQTEVKFEFKTINYSGV